MQRWTSVAIGALLVGAVAVVVVQARRATRPAASAASSASAAASGAPAPGASSVEASTEGALEEGVSDAGADGAAFVFLPDGKRAPALPPTAPKTVSFGVILFSYQGSELAPKGAPSRAEALERARAVVEAAQKDFADAAKQGDRGSTADAGRIPRGILEPAAEYVLFTLPPGQVYQDPVDTPRGWWIVRRND